MKIYIIRFNDMAYIEELRYSTHEERYEKTKGIDTNKIFEPSQLDKAIEIVYKLNKL